MNQTASGLESAGTATPCDEVVIPTKANPPGGVAAAAAVQLAPPSAEISMPALVAMTIAPDGVPATEVATPAAGALPASCHAAPLSEDV